MDDVFLTRERAEEWLVTGVPKHRDITSRFAIRDPLLDFSFGDSAPSTMQMLMPNFERMGEILASRFEFCREVSFALPSEEAILRIAQDGPIIEVGAGTGFWAALLAKAGGDVIATDSHTGHYGQQIGRYFPVEQCSAMEAIERYPERNLLMVWPSLGQEWAGEAALKLASGRLLFFVGEIGGAVAADNLFEAFGRYFEEVEELDIPRWIALNDFLAIYRRK